LENSGADIGSSAGHMAPPADSGKLGREIRHGTGGSRRSA
jgi:hypothetical protein